MSDRAKSDSSATGFRLLPPLALKRVAAIYREGLRYGEDNWKKGGNDPQFLKERFEHALAHLFRWQSGDRDEDHLAKVAWWCLMMLHFDEESAMHEGLENTHSVAWMRGDPDWAKEEPL